MEQNAAVPGVSHLSAAACRGSYMLRAWLPQTLWGVREGAVFSRFLSD